MYTSNTEDTIATDSVTNGAGLLVSHQVGFGVIDAEAMVTRALNWITVPDLEIDVTSPGTDNGYSKVISRYYKVFLYTLILTVQINYI